MKTVSRLILPTACLALVIALHLYGRTAFYRDIGPFNELGTVVLVGIIAIWAERRVRKK